VLGPGENEGLLGDALRDGRAVYASVDVCNQDQLIKGGYIRDLRDHTVFFL
jgi:sterol-4alpha-carboxylate 3-dehydrogenase (decarboxylating)